MAADRLPAGQTRTEDRVTVLIPVYNGRNFLQQQLDSILADPLVDRVLICDDASNDGTAELLESICTTSRVRFYRNNSNLGVIRTVESLLHRVETEYFALADQDDVWMENRIRHFIEMLDTSDAWLVYSDLTVVDERLSVIHRSRWQLSNQKPLRGGAVESMIVKSPVNGCTIVASSKLLRVALPFPRKIPMHDTWLATVAAALGKLEYIRTATVLYRQHGNNESGGASSYTVRGLARRLRVHAGGSIYRYSRQRLQHRLLLLGGLLQVGLGTVVIGHLSAVVHRLETLRRRLPSTQQRGVTSMRSQLSRRNLLPLRHT